MACFCRSLQRNGPFPCFSKASDISVQLLSVISSSSKSYIREWPRLCTHRVPTSQPDFQGPSIPGFPPSLWTWASDQQVSSFVPRRHDTQFCPRKSLAFPFPCPWWLAHALPLSQHGNPPPTWSSLWWARKDLSESGPFTMPSPSLSPR